MRHTIAGRSDAETQVMARSFGWDRTGKNKTGKKIACPKCGATGYPGGPWIYRHAHHEAAPCGKLVTVGHVGQHSANCRLCASAPSTPAWWDEMLTGPGLSADVAAIVDEMNGTEAPWATPDEVLALRNEVKVLTGRLERSGRELQAAQRALRRILGVGVYGSDGAETDFTKADDLLTCLGLETDY